MPDVRRPPRLALLAALPLVLLGTTGCSGDTPAPKAEPSAPSTPLESFSSTGLAVARGSFCPRLDPTAVEEALGATAATSTSYDNGDPARVTADVRDVAHEFSCTWTAADGTQARAWVFAPPVTPQRAQELARTAPHEAGTGCSRVEDAPAFGSPSAAVLCAAGGRVAVSHHGLFGDAWLSCSLAGPGTDRAGLLDRAGRWCVAVARAAAAG